MTKLKVLEKTDLDRLSHDAAKNYLDKLRPEIRRHDYVYYVKNRPEISDEEYDRLFETLKRLEERFPDVTTPDSPTQRVGAKPQEEFRVVGHTAPMLSLDATREEDDVRRFVERMRKSLNVKVRYLLEEKFDGASVELVYESGILTRAVTRGDGQKGEEITRGLTHPAVTLLALPTGRLINQREPFAIDLQEIFHAAKEHHVAVELNAQPDRLDLNDLHLFRATNIGVQIAINTDAHNVEQLRFIKYGIDQARRGWLEKRHLLNAMPCPQFELWLKQRRQGSTRWLRFSQIEKEQPRDSLSGMRARDLEDWGPRQND